jgi:hypothetical protein
VIVIVAWLMSAEAVVLYWRRDLAHRNQIMIETAADSFQTVHTARIEDQIKDDRSFKEEVEVDEGPTKEDMRAKTVKYLMMPAGAIMVATAAFLWEWGMTGRRQRGHAQSLKQIAAYGHTEDTRNSPRSNRRQGRRRKRSVSSSLRSGWRWLWTK